MRDSSGWSERSVFVTGHTGFKGGWLSLWLNELGAHVHGYALNPPTHPNLFDAAAIKSVLASDTRADLADLSELKRTLAAVRPEVIFHLAAQPLVREGYRDPLATLMTNVMGTAHVLEAARSAESVRSIVLVTSDKVYENNESGRSYREGDALGGRDPYSASKAAAEIVAASYKESFFGCEARHAAHVATARAGNVIGGGDWGSDRLMPDCLRSFQDGRPVHLRYPDAVRPWQHVLEPLFGYMRLALQLLSKEGGRFSGAWNFGQNDDSVATVAEVAEITSRALGIDARIERAQSPDNPHEAGLLRLDSTRARTELGWRQRWSLVQAVERTVAWHQSWCGRADMAAVSREQIHAYEASSGV